MLEFKGDTVFLSGDCKIDESDDLLDWIVSGQNLKVDLVGVTALHTAVLQVLMASKPNIIAWPKEGRAGWLKLALADGAPALSNRI